MSDRFHISPDGNPRPCSAEIKCKYGDGTPHYGSKDEAREAYEVTQAALAAMETDPQMVPVKPVAKSALMHPDQQAVTVGDYFVSTRPAPSINGKGGVDMVYETMLFKSDSLDEITTVHTRDEMEADENQLKAIRQAQELVIKDRQAAEKPTALAGSTGQGLSEYSEAVASKFGLDLDDVSKRTRKLKADNMYSHQSHTGVVSYHRDNGDGTYTQMVDRNGREEVGNIIGDNNA